MHDHETAMYHFGTGHGECNVHLLRYLKKNTEETGNSWSGKMSGLLSGINRARKEAMERGENRFRSEEVEKYKKEYREVLREGRQENKGTKHKYAKKEEKTLLNRLEKYKENHLLFVEDFRVPFDDNMSERDLRKAKNRQKMSGGFQEGKRTEDVLCNTEHPGDTQEKGDAAAGKYTESISGEDTGSFLRGGVLRMPKAE